MNSRRKLVVAVLKPFKLKAALEALRGAGVEGVVCTEARGYGRQKDHLAEYREDRFALAFLPKMRLEFSVAPETLRGAIELLMQTVRSGRQGDGKIWVMDAVASEPAEVRS